MATTSSLSSLAVSIVPASAGAKRLPLSSLGISKLTAGGPNLFLFFFFWYQIINPTGRIRFNTAQIIPRFAKIKLANFSEALSGSFFTN